MNGIQEKLNSDPRATRDELFQLTSPCLLEGTEIITTQILIYILWILYDSKLF